MKPPLIAPFSLLALLAPGAAAQVGGSSGVTELASFGEGGVQTTQHCVDPVASEDARYVAFETIEALVAADTNGLPDVYVVDRWTGSVTGGSTTAAGVFGDDGSNAAFLSADGRWLAFQSYATNFVPLDFNGQRDVFLKDLQTGSLERISNAHLSPNAAFGDSRDGSVSDDGRYVTFLSTAADIVPNDLNGVADVFVMDRQTGLAERISEGLLGEANGKSFAAMISGDGTRVAFESEATNLVLFDLNGYRDIFVKTVGGGSLKLVSQNTSGVPANYDSHAPSISADGSKVAFHSGADDLVANDNNSHVDVFVVDVASVVVERASVTSAGVELGAPSNEASMARSGDAVAFESLAPLAPYGTGNLTVYVRDLATDQTWVGSRPSGTTLVADGVHASGSLVAGGSVVVYHSSATNMTPEDPDEEPDVFVRTMHPDPLDYCAGASVTPQGCQPNLTTNGFPSVSSGAFFTFVGSDLPNGRNGILFYGFSGQSANPWAGSTMCVNGSKKRTPLMNTAGNPPPADDCTGFFAFDMNGFAAGTAGGNPSPTLSVVGQQVNVQFWGREGPTGTYLSTAVQYVVGP